MTDNIKHLLCIIACVCVVGWPSWWPNLTWQVLRGTRLCSGPNSKNFSVACRKGNYRPIGHIPCMVEGVWENWIKLLRIVWKLIKLLHIICSKYKVIQQQWYTQFILKRDEWYKEVNDCLTYRHLLSTKPRAEVCGQTFGLSCTELRYEGTESIFFLRWRTCKLMKFVVFVS